MSSRRHPPGGCFGSRIARGWLQNMLLLVGVEIIVRLHANFTMTIDEGIGFAPFDWFILAGFDRPGLFLAEQDDVLGRAELRRRALKNDVKLVRRHLRLLGDR